MRPARPAAGMALTRIESLTGDVVIVRAGQQIKCDVGSGVMQGDQIRTGRKSYCRIGCSDRTKLAVNESSGLTMARTAGDNPSELSLDAGAVYVDSPKRESPLVLAAGRARCSVIGTRLMVERGAAARLWVAEGEVLFSAGRSSARVMAGECAEETGPGGDTGMINVARTTGAPVGQFAWLDNAGVGGDQIAGAMGAAGRAFAGNKLISSGYKIAGGEWLFGNLDGAETIRQEDPAPGKESMLLLGGPHWKQGVVTLKFRVLKSAGDTAGVSTLLYYTTPNGMEMDDHGIVRQLAQLRELARTGGDEGWIAMRLEFKVESAEVLTSRFTAWAEKQPSRPVDFSYNKNPSNSRLRNRDVCGLGLLTDSCSVEFKDVKVEGPALAYYWNFNDGRVPPEFNVVTGAPLQCLRGDGVDKSTCLESGESVVHVDVPLPKFPFCVTYKFAIADPLKNNWLWWTTDWYPARNYVQLCVSRDAIKENVSPKDKYTPWYTWTEYHSGEWIARWRNGKFSDVTVSSRDPAGGLVFRLPGHALLDNVTITAISAGELPDVKPYLQAIADVPADKRKGRLESQVVAPVDGSRSATNKIVIKYLGDVSDKGWFTDP